MRIPLLVVGLTAFSLALPGIRPAQAEDVISRVPTVHVAIPGLESQAQLAARLRAEGFTDIVLSSTYPSPANPYPQDNPTLTGDPAGTPVHAGWNGVAVKGGTVFQVYGDR